MKKKNKSGKKTGTSQTVSTAPGRKTINVLLGVLGALIVIIVALIWLNSGDDNAIIPSLEESLIPEKPPVVEFTKNGYLHFINSENDTLSKIDIELVNSIYERSLGLMYRDKMMEDQGMLFIFPKTEPMGFWMKNTEISLDIIFVDADKNIAKIHQNTKPYSDSSYHSILPCKYVVETVAGYTDKYNISEGDKVVFVIESI